MARATIAIRAACDFYGAFFSAKIRAEIANQSGAVFVPVCDVESV
jgi:hypothetical protein